MSGKFRHSYSQFGEDVLIESYLAKKEGLTYIDIGCLWPVRLSNTYAFYQSGGSGLCIDPNPDIAEMYRTERPRDIFVNAGVSSSRGQMTYSMFSNPVFNTFDQARRDKVVRKARPGRELVREIEVPVLRLDDILDEVDWWNMHPTTDVLCIDVEGHEMDVLGSVQLARLRPSIIVCEMFGGVESLSGNPIVTYLKTFGYTVAGFTGHDVFMRAPA